MSSSFRLNETYDYITKFNSEKLNIRKSHSNDAFALTGNFNAETSSIEFLFRKVRRITTKYINPNPKKANYDHVTIHLT